MQEKKAKGGPGGSRRQRFFRTTRAARLGVANKGERKVQLKKAKRPQRKISRNKSRKHNQKKKTNRKSEEDVFSKTKKKSSRPVLKLERGWEIISRAQRNVGKAVGSRWCKKWT